MITVLFVTLFGCLALTVPIAVSIAISTLAVFAIYYPGTPMVNMLTQAMVTTSDSFPLMAVPFFMLVGSLMDRTGIAKRLVDVSEALTGSMPGGLGMAAVVSGMIFAAISGSGPAVVAAVGAILVPAMVKQGYDPGYAGGIVASAATIGPVIPPSIPMIVYGVTVGVSVTRLFTAGFLPGILMGIMLMVANYIICKKKGYSGLKTEGGSKRIAKTLWDAKWALLMPIIVLGGIYGGFFTPTESAVVGVIYSMIVGGVLYKSLTIEKVNESLIEAALLSATVMILLGGAITLGRLLTIGKIPEAISQAMLSATDNPLLILGMIMAFLLVTGCFIDTTSNVILFAPLFVPIITKVGYDPTFFGVIMVVNLCIGFLTPPLGMNLFVAQGVAKTSFENIVKNTLPFMLVLVGSLILMMLFPQIVLFLPELFGI